MANYLDEVRRGGGPPQRPPVGWSSSKRLGGPRGLHCLGWVCAFHSVTLHGASARQRQPGEQLLSLLIYLKINSAAFGLFHSAGAGWIASVFNCRGQRDHTPGDSRDSQLIMPPVWLFLTRRTSWRRKRKLKWRKRARMSVEWMNVFLT